VHPLRRRRGMGGNTGGGITTIALKQVMGNTTGSTPQPPAGCRGPPNLAGHDAPKDRVRTSQAPPESMHNGEVRSLRSGSQVAIAISVDSAHLPAAGWHAQKQITADHTFITALIVDSGRIAEEAAITPIGAHARARRRRHHPRSDTTTVFDVLPGDRWMLCSDGLSGPSPTTKFHKPSLCRQR
jgi:protein phosphatase